MPRPSPSSNRKHCGAKGFTLMEAMVSTVIFTMVMLGVYACIIKSYKLQQISRYNDEARAILLSYVDQFERLETTTNTNFKAFFNPDEPTGVGLNWPILSNDPSSNAVTSSIPYLEITLDNGTGSTEAVKVKARLTRAVYPVDPNTGALCAYNAVQSTYTNTAGCMLMGIFTLEYNLPSDPDQTAFSHKVRLVVLRAMLAT